jgi:hypothetical protein
LVGRWAFTVQRCVERAVVEGTMDAFDDRPRPGREPTITLEESCFGFAASQKPPVKRPRSILYRSDTLSQLRTLAASSNKCLILHNFRVQRLFRFGPGHAPRGTVGTSSQPTAER